jgi:hypothetical protein|tara:strand:+ start:1958 stop:2692 length:735 start_codon:yes stop_codon:yes gene_type:complete
MAKVIEFISHEEYIKIGDDLPKPATTNVPDWFKKLRHDTLHRTVKGCMPFLDALTAGYIFFNPVDLHIRHNVKNDKGELDGFQGIPENIDPPFSMNWRGAKPEYHQPFQLEGSPLLEKNKNLGIHKIISPWIIKTPPGYSCLFTSPFNNKDDRFDVITGIVDTDTFDKEINFPIVINGDKYPSLETTIKKGTPIAQIIPFKRDNWKLKIKGNTDLKQWHINAFTYGLEFLHKYKNKFWNKKSFK